jgi:hypothetical protein
MRSSKNHFLMIGGVKMRPKNECGARKSENDKAIASDSIIHQYRILNPRHVKDLKDNVKAYTKAIQAFIRARNKQDLKHRPASATEIETCR